MNNDDNDNESSQTCPLCAASVDLCQRYPNYVCDGCIDTHGVVTEDNKKITFANIDYTGGFKSKIEGDIEFGNVHACYINSHKCYADEARFGGIVISASRTECAD